MLSGKINNLEKSVLIQLIWVIKLGKWQWHQQGQALYQKTNNKEFKRTHGDNALWVKVGIVEGQTQGAFPNHHFHLFCSCTHLQSRVANSSDFSHCLKNQGQMPTDDLLGVS